MHSLSTHTDPISSVAFNQAVAEHTEGLMTYAARMLRDEGQAEDVTQDAFLALYRHLSQVPPTAIRPWLYRVTRNLCLDLLRRRKFKLMLFRDVGRDDDYEPTPPDHQEGRPDEVAQAREALQRFLESASPGDDAGRRQAEEALRRIGPARQPRRERGVDLGVRPA